jgi:hypothetical protein
MRTERIITAAIVARALARIGYCAPVAEYTSNTPPFFVRLRPIAGDGIRGLRQFLKAALRHYQLRCLSVTEESLPQLVIEHCETADDEDWGPTLPGYADDGKFYAEIGPRTGRRTRWRSIRIGTHQQQQETEMNKSDLEKLKNYAASSKSQIAFGGATFIMFDYKTGKVTAGKANVDMVDRKLVADMPDAMGGFRRLESGKKPLHALTRILDATVDPIKRAELGETDESKWIDKRDPWTAITVLPLFDPETRETFVFTAAFGERGAAGNLIEAYVDHIAAHPEAADQLPQIGFYVRTYTRSDGKPGYALQFDIDGWVDRPKAVLHIAPPPLTITTEAGKAGSGKSAESSTDEKAAKPRKIAVPGKDMDEDIPF